ncbi:GIY-YIG nuclease family protein [Kitasatospora terrestris]|uniref:Bacteriophage T5 Orf172 DNA-binding domain-containing protein n=1 Tax=Kitasatospora terrestris TaxID=258051 RepID=A0ABP9D7M3_9ACTN
MEAIPSLSAPMETRLAEYTELLSAGLLPVYSLPRVARDVERAVLDRAWSHAANPYGGHRLYVLSVAGSHRRVKIGQATDARVRIATHQNEYHVNGHGLVDAWISDPLPDAIAAERAVRALLRLLDVSAGHRREEYPNAPFALIRGAAITVTDPVSADRQRDLE